MLEGKFYPSKSEGITTMYYRIRKSRKMDLKITLKNIRISANSWNSKQQKFKPTSSKEYKDVLVRLSEFDKSVFSLSNTLQLNNQLLNLEILKTHYEKFFNLTTLTDITHNTPFKEYYAHYIQTNSRIDGQDSNGKNLSPNSVKGYKTMINIWNKFDMKTNIPLGKINYDVFRKFITYQESKLNLSKSSIKTNINKFNAILSYAYENGIDVHQDFIRKRFKFAQPTSKEVYLTAEELSRIVNLELPKYSTLDIVRDWFVIQSHTALRISDLFTLTEDNFEGDFINKLTIKTLKPVCIPILPSVNKILKKHNGLPLSIAQPTYNRLLKLLCEKAGINEEVEGTKYKYIDKTKTIKRKVKGVYHKYELVSSHTARRTYITLLSNNPNITNYEIMAVSGHTSVKTLEKYIRSSNKDRAITLKEKLTKTNIGL